VYAGTLIRRELSTAPPLPDWEKLGFASTPTRAMIRYDWEGKSWNSGTSSPDFNVTIHGLSNVLHYGQGLFEGLKAFHCKDGKVACRCIKAPRPVLRASATGTRLAPAPSLTSLLASTGARLQFEGQRRPAAPRRAATGDAGGSARAL
jgi:hypothetical protein